MRTANEKRQGRRVLSVIALLLSLACGEEAPTATAPAKPSVPTLPPVATSTSAPPASLTQLAVDSFDAGIEGWHSWGEEGALVEVAWDPTGQLLWSVDLQPATAAILIREWPELAGADGVTIRLRSRHRFSFLILAVQEADESGYGLILPLSAGRSTEYMLPFESFGLLDDSKDENGVLDSDQLSRLMIIDIAGFLGLPTPNEVEIGEVVLWSGTVAPFDLSCSAAGPATADADFRVGVDANYVPLGEQTGRDFTVGERSVDPIELFAANGADSFRVRLWLGDEGESKLSYATDVARRAQDAGLRPYLVLFLAEDWADVNKQPAPEAWADLSLDDRAEAIRSYTREAAQHFRDESVDIDFYEIGNEIDYGICGVFAEVTEERDPPSLRETIWPAEAQMIRSAIDGVREADPDARFMLHIANSWDPDFAVAFFQAMTDLGVTYDYVGLSLYPSAFGVAATSQFCSVLDALETEIGKPVILAETAYPAEPTTGGPFGDWRRPLPGYSLTSDGQARWVSDLLAGMRARSDVVGVYYFSPEFWFAGEVWGPFALFDGDGVARPAVGSFHTADTAP